jgi:P27 family predicted phage terminase small subunit
LYNRGEEPQPPKGVPDCPEWLGVSGRAKWAELAPLLLDTGCLTLADGDFLAMYCLAHDDLAEALAAIAKGGTEVVTEKGTFEAPAVKRKKDAIARIKQFGAEFGLSPSSRVGLGRSPEKKSDGLSAFAQRRGAS